MNDAAVNSQDESGKSAAELISRREAVLRTAGAAVCACCAGLAAGCQEGKPEEKASAAARGQYPPRPAGPQKVTTLDQISNDTPARFDFYGIPVFMLRAADAAGGVYVLVFDGRCPHARCRIEYQRVVVPADGSPATGGNFRCPCHGSTFTKTGERTSGPARKNLRKVWYEVRGEREIWVDLDREIEESTLSPLSPADSR